MAVTVRRWLDSTNGASSEEVLKNNAKYTMGKVSEIYTVKGVFDQTDAIEAVETDGLFIPAIGDKYVTMGGVTKDDLVVINKSAELLPTKNSTDEGLFRVTVQYDHPDRNTSPSSSTSNIGKVTYTFGGQTATEHISSLSSTSKRKSFVWGTTNHDGDAGTDLTINDSGGDVKGVDILQPSWTLTIQKVFARADITHAYLTAVHDVLGRVCDAPFPSDGRYYGAYQAGDCMLIGFRVVDDSDYNSDGSIACEFNFIGNFKNSEEAFTIYRIKPTDGTIESQNVTVDKNKGFTYRWVRSEKFYDKDGTTAGKMERILPVSVHLDTVYESADFSVLNCEDLGGS